MSWSTSIALEAIKDLAGLTLAVVGLYLGLAVYVRRKQPAWVDPLARRRAGILLLLAFAAAAIKLSEDVLGGESGPIDRAILLFVREHMPRSLDPWFAAITLSGSANVLAPLTVIGTLALLLARRFLEALLLGASVLAGAMVVFVIKAAVGRTRPALWDTEWYWGSSFPSGHTLVVAAFATACALCIGRIWPTARRAALGAALAWTLLVALSRLVLGVHWPTDVLVAGCMGAALPLAISLTLELREHARAKSPADSP